ncbi:MAG: ATP-binding protein [Cyclobacteriaceae bacterium]
MKASKIISEKKGEILSGWIELVIKDIPDARHRKLPVLKNNIPKLLDALVEALSSDDARTLVFNSGTHGEERARETAFTLQQVLKEYRLLKQIIFNIIDEQGDTITPRERDGIMFAIDQAVEQSAEAFFEERHRITAEGLIKAEKLTLKLQEQGTFRDRFVATLSHDLRGPLNNTISAAELLKEHLMPDDNNYVGKLLNIIKISTLRANTLINNLLDINLIQSGQPLPLKPKEADLLLVMEELLQGYEPAVQERIKLHSDADAIKGNWDVNALVRAVDNLINNALKYGEGNGKIVLKLEQDEQKTLISVHNHGNVIPKEKIDHLFDPYYRIEKPGSKGWGLGLTLVKGIAGAHGGSIRVISDEDKGTVFTIEIPNSLEI